MQVISKLDPQRHVRIALPSKSTTGSIDYLQSIISSPSVVRRRRNVLGPPVSASSLLLTIEGVDRPQQDEWGVRETQEFIRYIKSFLNVYP